ncbi:Acetylornithine aminotransferase [Clostridium bornimense]|uniref:Acetylornithine aminotransferase n=1 Tax=Clostridium bornimense TaxID=1216932 RepID=W6SI25_9CLOT|nr:aspartate aminotransferase family protein [Clostridium bornimense]CDM69350.1 Acetylornithine aminotransferase [Clostridium bornimense]
MSKSNLMNSYKRYPVTFVKGEGIYLYDENNEKYIDFVSGVAVNALGHCSPVIKKAIQEQSEKVMHISNYYYSNEAIDLSELLCKDSDFDSVFFTNSGTESIEGAMKICRKYGNSQNTNKNKIISMKNSFHGRSLGALSITGREVYKTPFYPMIPGVIEAEFNNIESLENAFNDDVCGVFIEPVQGEGGINAATPEFLKKARELCDKHNALLVFDEIQCGAGRIGTYFCKDTFDVLPDVVCMAKGLGGGFPIGAIVTTGTASNVITYGNHGTTYGGNPLACAVSKAVTSTIKNAEFLNDVKEKGNYLKEKLSQLQDKFDFITKVKGLGLLVGIEVSITPSLITNEAFKNKLLIITAGENVIRFLPPLNVTKEEIDLFIERFTEVLKNVQLNLNK